jgi:hypothetical protein
MAIIGQPLPAGVVEHSQPAKQLCPGVFNELQVLITVIFITVVAKKES